MSTPSTPERQLLTPPERHCIRCGRADVRFRSARALKCLSCDKLTSGERKDYHKDYHAARGRAMRRLIGIHPEEWDRLLAEEHESVKDERVTGTPPTNGRLSIRSTVGYTPDPMQH